MYPLKQHPLGALHAAAMVALMLVLAITSFRFGMADLMAVRADNTLNAVKSGTQQKTEELQNATEWVKSALEINRHYAPYIETLGNVYLARQLALNEPGESGMEQGEAVDRFRQLLRYRPTWAFGWGGLILAKVTQLEFDDELTRALEQVATRYPYMPQVQVLAATSALSAWQFLDNKTRDKLMGSIRYAYSQQPDTLKDAADTYGEMEVLCPMLDAASRNQYCP